MKELNNLIDTHQQLLSQLSENQQVLKVGAFSSFQTNVAGI